jgi:radical SAM protein with 4Fe4S-binding SPASM domain
VDFLKGYLDQEEFTHYRDEHLNMVDRFTEREEQPCASTCLAGRCSFTINWQGQIRPCVVMTEPAVDVFETGFEAGWKQISQTFQELRYCAKCSNCRLRPVCRTCPAAALLESGDYMGTPEYLCRYAAECERLLRESAEETTNE